MSFDNLDSARFMSLVTTKRSGEEVATPVWFADTGGALVVGTGRGTGKVKRIAHTPAVTVAPCTARGRLTGSPINGLARLAQGSEVASARGALSAKYRLLWRFFDRRIDTYLVIESA